MKLPRNPNIKFSLVAALAVLVIVVALIFRHSPDSVEPRSGTSDVETNELAQAAEDLADSSSSDESGQPDESEPQSEEQDEPVSADVPSPKPPSETESAPEPESKADESSDEIQLSFKGANIDMVVEWLAKTTGKSVVKHPRVQCQLTIVSSKKLAPRDAITLVYRALSLEGFATVETTRSILIVPEDQEPKMSPELMDGSKAEIPEGRQRLVKVFEMEHLSAGEVKDRIKGVVSEKAIIEADQHGNRIIVTDYTENIRLLGELIEELDVPSISDTAIEIFTLQYSDAEDLASLLTLVLNASAGGSGPSPPGSPSPSPSPSPSSPSSSGGTQAGAQAVRFWPDKTVNRLIVSAPRSKLSEIKHLIDVLDTEKPEDVGVRVLPLKHVSADDLVKEIGPLYQKMSGKSLKERIEVTANLRSNSLILLSSEANYQSIQKLVSTLDVAEAQEKVLRAFPLKNADAQDVADQLEELYRGQSTTARYVYYFSPQPQRREHFSVVADRRRNTVIVQAPPSAMETIAEMVETLDEPVQDDSLAPRIYPLKYVSALDIEDVLNELLLKQQPQRNYWDYYYGSQEPERDVGRLYGKVRITSEPYSNSIIVTSNSPENLEAVEQILKQLDVPSQAGETTLRVGLQFSDSVAVANKLNILFARSGSPPLRQVAQQPNQPDGRNQQQQNAEAQRIFELQKEASEEGYYPWLGGQQENFRSLDGRTGTRPVSDLVGKVRVVADPRTNTLLITSNVHFFPQVLKLIHELDIPTPQILIEAKIIEVSSDFRERLGVRWSPDGTRVFDPEDLDDSIIGSATGTYSETFLGSAMADSLRTGILDASVSLDVLIQFLRKNSESKILAEPQINVADNELGKLFVGAQVPFISNSIITDVGGRSDSFQYRDVGIILEVTPHISNEDEVALRIRVESSNIRAGETLFGGAILDTRTFRTDLVINNGQTIVLGGIIQREEIDTIRKVPWLGSIPGLGWAFKKRDSLTRDVELMVFLRPRITRTPEEVNRLLEEIEERIPHMQRWMEGRSEEAQKTVN